MVNVHHQPQSLYADVGTGDFFALHQCLTRLFTRSNATVSTQVSRSFRNGSGLIARTALAPPVEMVSVPRPAPIWVAR